jgi:hypothetical protein
MSWYMLFVIACRVSLALLLELELKLEHSLRRRSFSLLLRSLLLLHWLDSFAHSPLAFGYY